MRRYERLETEMQERHAKSRRRSVGDISFTYLAAAHGKIDFAQSCEVRTVKHGGLHRSKHYPASGEARLVDVRILLWHTGVLASNTRPAECQNTTTADDPRTRWAGVGQDLNPASRPENGLVKGASTLTAGSLRVAGSKSYNCYNHWWTSAAGSRKRYAKMLSQGLF